MNDLLTLSKDEVAALLDYFINRAGYISFEFDMPVHEIIKKLQEFGNACKGSKESN